MHAARWSDEATARCRTPRLTILHPARTAGDGPHLMSQRPVLRALQSARDARLRAARAVSLGSVPARPQQPARRCRPVASAAGALHACLCSCSHAHCQRLPRQTCTHWTVPSRTPPLLDCMYEGQQGPTTHKGKLDTTCTPAGIHETEARQMQHDSLAA